MKVFKFVVMILCSVFLFSKMSYADEWADRAAHLKKCDTYKAIFLGGPLAQSYEVKIKRLSDGNCKYLEQVSEDQYLVCQLTEKQRLELANFYEGWSKGVFTGKMPLPENGAECAKLDFKPTF